jgi:hypothetical protein
MIAEYEARQLLVRVEPLVTDHGRRGRTVVAWAEVASLNVRVQLGLCWRAEPSVERS